MKLTRGNWEEAAYRVLLERGPRAVAVAPLSEQLGVTRGSFYHYFSSREELLEAALGRWERQATDALIAVADAEHGPHERLQRLFSQVFRSPTRLSTAERHLLAERESDQIVEGAVARVTRRRKEYLATCYRDLGYGEVEAMDRALVAYMAFIGWLYLDETSRPDDQYDEDRLSEVVNSILLPPAQLG